MNHSVVAARPAEATEDVVALDATRGAPEGLSGSDSATTKWTAAVALVVVVLTVALRVFRLDRAYDVFVDEITYLHISQSISEGRGLDLHGEPFFLHPPLFLMLQAVIVWLVDLPADAIDSVLMMRYFIVALAAVTAVIAWRMASVIAGSVAGAVAGLLFALDPFIIRLNSRILIETAAMLFASAGWLILAAGLLHGRELGRSRLLACGLAFGAAVLCKDVTSMVTLLPLAFVAVFGVIPPRKAALVTAVAIAMYSIYGFIAVFTSHGSEFIAAKNRGSLRFIGTIRETGFNTADSTSFSGRVLDQMGSFASSYAVLVVGAVAVVVLWRSGRGAERLVAAWLGSSYLLGGFSIVQGTLEEQLFYFISVPAVIAVPIAAATILQDQSASGSTDRSEMAVKHEHVVGAPSGVVRNGAAVRSSLVKAVMCVGALSIATMTTVSWIRVRTTQDDSQRRLVEFASSSLDPTDVVATTSDTEQFVLSDVEVIQVRTVDELRASDADFVVVGTKGVEDGTALVDHTFLEYLERDFGVVFAANGPSVGELRVYSLD